MIVQEIAVASAQYEAMKRFREENLRLPLGLKLSDDDLKGEDAQIHIAAVLDDGAIAGTVLLKPLDRNRAKLRQMAVAPALRRGGIGRKLVRFAEDAARARGFRVIELHARIYAQGFYERLDYRAAGEPFVEATLPTIKMVKRLAAGA